MKLRVLHILGTAQPAGTGVARLVQHLAGALDPARCQLYAWFLLESGPLVNELRQAGVTAEFVPWLPSPRDPAGAWRLWRKLSAERFDVLHQHFGGPRVRWVARRAGVNAIVLHLHGRVSEVDGRLVTLPTHHADVVLASSQAVADHAEGGRARVVHTGVPLAESVPVGRTEVIIGTAARLIPLKGIHFLLQAFAQLTAEDGSLRLEIAGDGPERERLQAEAQTLGIAGRVSFLGWQSGLHHNVRRWSIYVQPSLEEGLALALLEAMAAGLPVVATAAGGTAELVQEGCSGFLVAPRDVAALAHRLGELAGDPALRLRMGAAARSRVAAEFSPERMARQVMLAYHDARSGVLAATAG